jgi:hypothetical protein
MSSARNKKIIFKIVEHETYKHVKDPVIKKTPVKNKRRLYAKNRS